MQEKEMKTIKKNKSKISNGITLIALVVTIVVLLILAGVSIVVLFGDNGIIKQAQNSSLQTKFADIEERANVIYADLDSKRYAEGNTKQKVTMGEIAKELQNQKYIIKEVAVGENVIEAIELEPSGIKMGKNDTAKIKVNFKKNEEGVAYYVKVEDKYYKISLDNGHITLDKANGKTEEELLKNENIGDETQNITANSNEATIVTVKNIDQNEKIIEIESKEALGIAEITVTYGELEPQKCIVTVAIKPIEESTNIDNSVTTDYGRIDVIWLDEHNNIVPEPNAPILESETNGTVEAKTKMRAIKWVEEDGNTKDAPADETNPNKEWYDYREKDIEEGVAGSNLADNTTSHWANAKTEDGSYFVWIPRYAYRITYYANEKSTVPTGYYDGHGMWSAENGKKKLDLEEGIETVEHNGELYIVHPAFGTTKTDEKSKTQNIELGGWDKPLTGFWFAKFEMSGQDADTLKSVPGVKSRVYGNIGECYTIARTANYGQMKKSDEEENGGDGNASFMHSHMSKNSEWGAVAYLAHSQYGRNGHEVSQNNYSGGYAGGSSAVRYCLNNGGQTTTGNVYGVFDMSGGEEDTVAAFKVDAVSYLENASSIVLAEGISSKYATAYHSVDGNYITSVWELGKTGDATKEVYLTSARGWFNDYINFGVNNTPFLVRGGTYNDNYGSYGIFRTTGFNALITFRTVLCK